MLRLITFIKGVKSWSFPASAVELVSGGIDNKQYAENDEWEMTSSEVTKQNVTVGGVEQRYYRQISLGCVLKKNYLYPMHKYKCI